MLNKILITLVALSAMAAGFWFADNRNTGVVLQQPQFQGRIVTPPRAISMPALTLDDGSVFDLEDLAGHWSLLFFGYTNCPDICPTTLNTLAQAKQSLKGEFPDVVFISVDPQRDTVDILGDYVRYFDPAFRGVTGSPEMLQALSLQSSVVYMPVTVGQGEEETYLVEHSSSILLLNPEGKLHAFIQAPHSASNILKAIEIAVNNQ